MFTWLSTLVDFLFGFKNQHAARPRQARTFRPTSEQLECRIALATFATYDPATTFLTFTDDGSGPTTVQLWSDNASQLRFSATGLADPITTGQVISTVNITNAGAGYADGIYNGVALTGGTGTGATADITVVGGIVDSVTIPNGGIGYLAGDTLTATAANFGAGVPGTAFSVQVSATTPVFQLISAGVYETNAPGAVGKAIVNLGDDGSTLKIESGWTFNVQTDYVGTSDNETLDLVNSPDQPLIAQSIGTLSGFTGLAGFGLPVVFSDLDTAAFGGNAGDYISAQIISATPVNYSYAATGIGAGTITDVSNTRSLSFSGLGNASAPPVTLSVTDGLNSTIANLEVSHSLGNQAVNVRRTNPYLFDPNGGLAIEFSDAGAPDLNATPPTNNLSVLGDVDDNDAITVATPGVESASIFSGGGGYAVGDQLQLDDPLSLFTSPAILEVTSVAAGVIDGIKVLSGGWYSTPPTSPVATVALSGIGSGATFNVVNGFATLNFPSLTINGQGGTDSVTLGSSLLLGNGGTNGDLTITAEAINLSAASINTTAGTNAGTATFNGPTTLVASSVAITTDSAAGTDGNVAFNSTVNGTTVGGESLTLTAGSGNIDFTGAVGGTTRVGALSIQSAGTVNAVAITAASLQQVAGGTTNLNGAVNTNTAAGVQLAGTTLNVNAGITTTNSGVVTVNESGVATFNSSANINADGAVTLTAGSISTGGDITTTADDVTIQSPTTLTDNIFITTNGTGAAAGDITLNGTVNGAQNLEMTAADANITINNVVGGTTPLNAITIHSAADVTVTAAGSIAAASLKQELGSGTTTLNGAMTTSGAAGVDLKGTNLFANALVTTTGGGTVKVDELNTATFTATGDIAADGAVTLKADAGTSTAISTAGNITTTRDNVLFSSKTTLTGNVAIDTTLGGPGSGNIQFADELNAANAGVESLNLTAGTGSITFSSSVGNTVGPVELGPLTINSALNVTAVAITAASVTQIAGTGTTTLNGPVVTNTPAGVSLTGGTLVVNQPITATNGAVSVSESATATFAAAGDITADLPVSLTAANGISTAGNVTTSDDDVTFVSATTLTGPVVVSTGVGGAGNIAFNSTINGTVDNAQSLTLTAGTGNVTLAGNVGQTTRLGAVTVTSATNVTAAAIRASSLTQQAGSGLTTLNGAVDTNTGTGVSLTGANLAVNNTITTTVGGGVSVNESGTATFSANGDINSDGAVSLTAATISTAGNVTTSDANVTYNAPTTLTGPVAVDTGVGVGNIAFNSTLSGSTANGQTLDLTAGTGDISFAGAVGSNLTPLGAITINSAKDVTAVAIDAQTLTQVAGTGLTSLTGAVTTRGVSLTGNNLSVTALITTTNSGTVVVNESGTATFNANGDINADGAVSLTAAGGIFTAADIKTTGDSVTVQSATTLDGDVKVDTSTGSGNITFNSTVNGSGVAGGQALELTADGGDIALNGVVGASKPLGALTIISADDVQAIAITAASVKQNAGTGTTTLNGVVTTSSANGVQLTGTNLVVNSGIDTTGGGVVTIVESGTATFNVNGDINATGPVSITATGGITTEADVTTDDDNITFASATVLDGSVALSTGAASAGNILFSSTLTGTSAGAPDLTLTSGTGNVTFNNTVGATRLGNISIVKAHDVTAQAVTAASLTQTAANPLGTTTLNGAVNTNTATGVQLNGYNLAVNAGITTTNNGVVTLVEAGTATFAVNGDINADGAVGITATGGITTAGDVTTSDDNITFSSPTTLSGSVQVNTGTTAGGDILYSSTLNGTSAGAQALSLNAGTGNVTFNNTVGASVVLGAINVATATDVTAANTVSAVSLTQQAGTGTTTLNGQVSTSGVAGVNLTGTTLAVNAPISTTGGGIVNVDESNTATFAITSGITADGQVDIEATNGITTAANITTTGDNVTFKSATTLSGGILVDTGAGLGNISFDSSLTGTVSGAQTLGLTAGTGNVTFNGVVGATPLGAVTITSAADVTVTGTGSIAATSLQQVAGSGTTLLNGPISTSGAAGINLKGTLLTVNKALGTTGGGTVTVDETGAVNFGVDGDINSDGAVNLKGALISTAGNITTTNDNVTFQSPTTLTGNAAIDTGAGVGNILFSADLSSGTAEDLTLTAGTGDVNFASTVGNAGALGALSIVSAKDVTFAAASSAAVVDQASGTGTTTFTGAVTAGTASSIATKTIVLTANTGALSVTTGNLSLTAGDKIEIQAGASLSASGSATLNFGQSTLDSLIISGNVTANTASVVGTDTMTVNYETADIKIGGYATAMNFNATGVGPNKIVANGSTGIDTVTVATNSIKLDKAAHLNSAITFSNVQLLTLNAGDAADIVNVTGTGATATVLNGQVGDDVFNLSGGTGLTVNGDVDNDDFNVNGATAGTLNGNDGLDEFTLQSTLTGSITGGNHADTIWMKTGATVTGTVNGNAGSDKLTYATRTGSVAFTLSAAGSTDGYKGSGTGLTGASPTFDNIDLFEGNGTGTNVTGLAGTGTWLITGANSGTYNGILTFSGATTLTGGAGNDTFSTNAYEGIFAGVINGGAGNDTIDYSLNSTVATSYTVNALNAGFVQSAGNSFTSVESIKAGSLNDTFLFTTNSSSLASTLNGGGGLDTLNYTGRTLAVQVDLTLGTASSTGGVSNIENVTGTVGNDVIIGSAVANVINGGAGNNILVGNDGDDTLSSGAGAGRSILIGGNGNDTLTAGSSGGDILIGKRTSYDANRAALSALLMEWTRTDATYFARRDHLLGTLAGGLNGAYRINATTVLSSSGVDIVNGGSNVGQNWYVVAAAPQVASSKAGETITVIP